MTYNGWKNYETWNVPLWIDNSEPMYRARIEQRRWRGPFTPLSAHAFCQRMLGTMTPDGVDLWNPAIDWQEVADHWNEE